MTASHTAALGFSLEDLRRDVRSACLEGPGDPKSSEILDPYGFISQPPILRRLGMWIATQLGPDSNRLVAVGASALGLALAAGLEQNVPVAFVQGDEVYGESSSGDVATVIADIARTGRSARAAIDVLTRAGSTVDAVLIVWDRSLGALDLLDELRIPVRVLMEERLSEWLP